MIFWQAFDISDGVRRIDPRRLVAQPGDGTPRAWDRDALALRCDLTLGTWEIRSPEWMIPFLLGDILTSTIPSVEEAIAERNRLIERDAEARRWQRTPEGRAQILADVALTLWPRY
jgi:hypothetical protein